MNIFDCFMYFDEEQILELRLNALDEKVDFFVIVESIYNHKGDKRDLLFNKNTLIICCCLQSWKINLVLVNLI